MHSHLHAIDRGDILVAEGARKWIVPGMYGNSDNRGENRRFHLIANDLVCIRRIKSNIKDDRTRFSAGARVLRLRFSYLIFIPHFRSFYRNPVKGDK